VIFFEIDCGVGDGGGGSGIYRAERSGIVARNGRAPARWKGMNESMTTELRELRARAYGPDADLHSDPTALGRLRELEEIARGRQALAAGASPREEQQSPAPAQAVGAPTDPALTDPRTVAATGPVVADPGHAADAGDRSAAGATRITGGFSGAEADAAASGPALTRSGDPHHTAKGGGRWNSRRVAVVLIASVVGAVVLTAAVTGVVSRRVQADPREVGVLSVDPYASIPEMFGNWQCDGGECTPEDEVEGVVFTEFYGLSAFTIPAQFMGEQESASCLMLIESSQMDIEGNSFNGRIYNGCGAGEFPAIIQVPVTRELPAELRAEFPEGSGLQFILEGSEVIVLSDQP
jgi:hypothetical protein